MLAILKRLRTHLINNWEVAGEWARRQEASNGARCFYALRPECENSQRAALSYAETIRLVLAAVSRRRSLAHGMLHDGTKHCAMGCFWEDHPNVPVYTYTVDKIASFNDLTPKATPKARWKRMVKWLRNEVASL